MDSQLNNSQTNCVRVQHIVKDVGMGEKVARHFDNILDQVSTRVGQFAHVLILKNAKPHQPNEKDTIGFLQLKDQSRHRELAFLLKDYCFHGKYLDVQLASFNFPSIDDDYLIRPVNCRYCNYYLEDLHQHEQQVMNEALEAAKLKISVSATCMAAITTNLPVTKHVESTTSTTSST